MKLVLVQSLNSYCKYGHGLSSSGLANFRETAYERSVAVNVLSKPFKFAINSIGFVIS